MVAIPDKTRLLYPPGCLHFAFTIPGLAKLLLVLSHDVPFNLFNILGFTVGFRCKTFLRQLVFRLGLVLFYAHPNLERSFLLGSTVFLNVVFHGKEVLEGNGGSLVYSVSREIVCFILRIFDAALLVAVKVV